MGFLKKTVNETDDQGLETPSCPHTALVQHWEHPDDMSRKEFAIYVCEACGERFTYDQAQQLLEHPNVGTVEEATDLRDTTAATAG